jgi:membrane-associated protease RseP (regulator of RpoE activity)
MKALKPYLIAGGLFLATFFTTTLAGVQWVNKDPLELSNFLYGLPFSVSILLILGSHEFGHYFAARYHSVDVTLPYFIPFPPFPLSQSAAFLFNPFGTMGAVIRMRSQLQSKKTLFDIGIAGPLAGLIVTMAILLYGFFTLPGMEYLYRMHPEYLTHTPSPEEGFAFGNSVVFWALSKVFGQHAFVPPMTEIYHYPYLCAGWFGLFVTALNLIPVGQLDGGHIIYALIGPKLQIRVAWVFFILLVIVGLLGLLPLLIPGANFGSISWLVWAAILYFIIKLRHPAVPDQERLSTNRMMLGWITFLIFIIIFPPVPFYE